MLKRKTQLKLLYSFKCINVKQLNEKIKYLYKALFNRNYTNKFSTGMFSIDFSVDPIYLQVWGNRHKHYFRIYTLSKKTNIYYHSFYDMIMEFNDEQMKQFYNPKHFNFFKKMLILAKIKIWEWLDNSFKKKE